MNTKTKNLIRDIALKVKSPITNSREFQSEDAVIDYAIELLHNDLRKRKLL